MLRHARPIWLWLLLGGVLDICSVLCSVACPALLGDLTQLLCDSWDAGRVEGLAQSLVPPLVVLALAYAGSSLLSYGNMYLMNSVVTRHFTCGLRTRLSEKIRFLPVKYVDQTPVGDILNRMLDDVSTMGGYIHQIFDVVVKGVFQLALITVLLFLENWSLAIFVVLLTPLSLWFSSKMADISGKYYDKMFEQSGKMTELVEESFTNFATTKAYNLEEYTQEKHHLVNEEQKKLTIRANLMGSLIQPIIKFTNTLAYILINLLGGWLMLHQGVSVGVVVTVVLYARQFASPLEQLAYGFSQISYVRAAADRVFKLLDMPQEDPGAGALPQKVRGKVELEDVSFSYDPQHKLIENLNVRVRPGQKVAIVGPTGAGKTTIVNLLMRFYDPDAGRILLDGTDIRELSREEVRSCFGMVLQDTWLFKGTIAENVAYGKPGATRQQVEDACRQAYCHHFIQSLPQGYDTVVSDDTATLSGGQKQLLTIARALLADKPLLILDEATSNVDTRTEVMIQKAMDKLMEGKTCFVIAHRLSTIVDSDTILVLDHGHIVEQGTHRQLLRKKGFYEKLYRSQYAV